MAAPVKWLSPWYGVEDEAERRGLEGELRREICNAHVLAGEPVTLLARRGDMDEALYLLPLAVWQRCISPGAVYARPIRAGQRQRSTRRSKSGPRGAWCRHTLGSGRTTMTEELRV